MADLGVVEFSTVLPEGWQMGDPPFTFEGRWAPSRDVSVALLAVRSATGLTRNGRMRSVLRDSDLWRLLTACVVAGREVVTSG